MEFLGWCRNAVSSGG